MQWSGLLKIPTFFETADVHAFPVWRDLANLVRRQQSPPPQELDLSNLLRREDALEKFPDHLVTDKFIPRDSPSIRHLFTGEAIVWFLVAPESEEYDDGNCHSKTVIMDIIQSLKMAKQVAPMVYKTKDDENLSAFVIAPSNKKFEALNIYPCFRPMIGDDALLLIVDKEHDI